MYNSPLKWRLNNIFIFFLDMVFLWRRFPAYSFALKGCFCTASANEPAISGDLVLK